MPDDLSLLDQLEEWLEAQVPANLHELPFRMLETMERVSNELFETLNIHGPPSISIPFPPFLSKESLPPPPPPPPPPLPFHTAIIDKTDRWAKEHPYLMTGGAVLAVTVGLGVGARLLGYGPGSQRFERRFGTKAFVQDGMLKEAVVLLCPSPMPPILIPLTATLLRAGYIVLIAVPQVKDAESVERRLSGLEERSGLRVLIYNPEDSTTFPPFHRSLLATLTLRFPAVAKNLSSARSKTESVSPRIHAFVSLYPLNPSPPSQPSALPALPTLLAPTDPSTRPPMLITFYPSTSVLPTPDTFASQVLTSTHHLLSQNLAASMKNRIISLYVGDIALPSLPAIISTPTLSRREQTRLNLHQAVNPRAKASILTSYTSELIKSVWLGVTAHLGLFGNARSYDVVEKRFLRILKSRHGRQWSLGQYSFLPLVITKFNLPPFILPYLLSALPSLPLSTGPTHTLTGISSSTHLSSTSASASASASTQFEKQGGKANQVFDAGSLGDSDEHEHEHEAEGEDLGSSIHTGVSSSSGEGSGNGSGSGSGNGLDGSWIGLEAAN